MKPDDANAKLTASQRPFRILIIPALTDVNIIARVSI